MIKKKQSREEKDHKSEPLDNSKENPRIKKRSTIKSQLEYFRSFYDNSPLPYQSLDKDGCFIEINSTFLDTLGYSREEIIGHSFEDFLTEASKHKFRDSFPKLKKEGQINNAELEVIHKNKSIVIVSIKGNVEYDLEDEFVQTHCVWTDITKQKQTELELQTSEELFRALVEHSPDFIARYDKEYKRVYVNPAIQKLFPGSQTDNILGRSPLGMSPLNDPQKYVDHIQNVFDTETESISEFTFRTPEGENHWSQVRFVPEFDVDGNVATVLMIARDINEVKEKASQFRMLAENFPDSLIRLDRELRYTYVNTAIVKEFGLSAEEIVGNTIHDIPQSFDSEQKDNFIELVKDTFTKGVINKFDVEWNTPNGHRNFEIRLVPEKDASKNVISLLCIIKDITESKYAEIAIRENEELLSSIVENIPNMIFLKDAKNLTWLRFNKAGEELLGYDRKELIGKSDFDYFPKEQAQYFFDKDKEVLADGKLIDIPEEPIDTKFGKRILNTKKIPILDKNGEPAYLLGISEDITKRKQTEEERLVHLKFIESIDRINRAFQGTNKIEKMMSNVLNTTLSIFNCDRAFLVYPCDPNAYTWHAKMECNKPQYPRIYSLEEEIKMDPRVADTFRSLLNSSDPVTFSFETEGTLQKNSIEQFGYKSSLAMALSPMIDKPWQFEIHQCSHVRNWTTEEKQLFKEIGRRLEDSLTSFIINKNLKQSEERFRRLAENAQDVIFRMSLLDGNFEYISPAASSVFGYSPVECYKSPVLINNAIHPDWQDYLEEQWKNLIKGEILPTYDYQFIHKSGKIRWLNQRNILVRDDAGNPIAVEGIVTDVTERILAETEINRLAELQSAILNNAAYIVISSDVEGIITTFNPAAEKALGYSAKECVGQLTPDVFHHADEVSERAKIFSGELDIKIEPGFEVFVAKARRDLPNEYEWTYIHKDGHHFPVLLSVTALRDSQGNINGFLGMGINITERKQAEEEVKEQMDEINRFNRLMVGREEKMIELKKEINAMLEKEGKSKKYSVLGI